MQLGCVTVNVMSEGKLLDEHLVDIDEDSGVGTCWIPSNEGYEFSVRCSTGNRDQSYELRLLIDGVTMDECVLYNRDVANLWGTRVSADEVCPYIFRSGVKATEDYDEEERDYCNPQLWKKRGRISLELCPVNVIHIGEYAAYYAADESSLATVSVGPITLHTRATHERDLFVLYPDECGGAFVPHYTFHFKHRPTYWLEDYGIIPRPFDLDLSAWSLSDAPGYVAQFRDMSLGE